MVDKVKAALDPLARDGGELYGFRHGGDEFSFVLRPKATPEVTAANSKLIQAIQSALEYAQESISASLKSWKGSHQVADLTTIENPKKCLSVEIQDLLRLNGDQRKRAAEACKPHRGRGIYFGVSPILPLPPSIIGREADCWIARNIIEPADSAMSAHKTEQSTPFNYTGTKDPDREACASDL
jgi:hypothetical protein